MSERARAVTIATWALDRPNADPDDDLAILARQFLRAIDRPVDRVGGEGLGTEDSLRIAVVDLADMIGPAYCYHERFETCGDPFCVEARQKRDAILNRAAFIYNPDTGRGSATGDNIPPLRDAALVNDETPGGTE